jgi:serine/threonine protein kinase/tetratricopeptide (TPR) repeat protein
MEVMSSFSLEYLKRLDSSLDEALSLDHVARESYLLLQEQADPLFCQQLKRLLECAQILTTGGNGDGDGDSDVGRTTNMPWLKLSGMKPNQVQQPAQPGEMFGPWRVVELIGRGGMGDVWLAERADNLMQRVVALKIVRSDARTEQLRERLKLEREILAQLDHPGIARLFDAGISEKGSPYLVLEYVKGLTIIEHATQKALGLSQRVELLLQICDALGHAHAKLVIHRDLKPNNVMVDENGKVRLLDFGIAKRFLVEDSDAEVITVEGERAFTPMYAAPEQILGARVSTATDVYGLGLLAYELLSGIPAFQDTSSSKHVMAKRMLEDDIGPMSSVASLPALKTKLAYELDWIVQKALKRDPKQRYRHVDALAADLRAWRDGGVVQAKPLTRWYRASRWLQRHRYKVAGISALWLTLLAGGLAAVWQAKQTQIALANSEARRDFIEAILKETMPWARRGEPLDALGLLKKAEQSLEEKFPHQIEMRFELYEVFHDMYFDLGAESERVALAERWVQLGETGGMEKHYQYVHALNMLTAALTQTREYARAISLSDRAIAASSAIDSRGEEMFLRSLYHRAQLHLLQGDAATARPFAERAYRLAKAVRSPEKSLLQMNSAYLLAQCIHVQGHSKESLQYIEEAYQHAQHTKDGSHRIQVESQYLASLFTKGEYTNALEGSIKLEQRAKILLGESSPYYWPIRRNILVGLQRLNRWEEAERQLIAAIDNPMAIKFDPQFHLTRLSDLILIKLRKDANDSAIDELMAQADDYQKRIAAPPIVLTSIDYSRSSVAMNRQQYDQAIQICDAAISSLRGKAASTISQHELRFQEKKALALMLAGRRDAGLKTMQLAYDATHRILPLGHPQQSAATAKLALLMRAASDPRASETKAKYLEALGNNPLDNINRAEFLILWTSLSHSPLGVKEQSDREQAFVTYAERFGLNRKPNWYTY